MYATARVKISDFVRLFFKIQMLLRGGRVGVSCRVMGRLSVGRCGVGFVGVLADLAVWASARGLVLLTYLKRCGQWPWLRLLFISDL